MYSRKCSASGVNEARKELFAQCSRTMENIPPTKAALLQHVRRAAHQLGYVWSQADADDTTLLAGTKEDLIELVERVRRTSEKAGLYLNVGKTKVMTTGDIGEVTVDEKDIEVLTKFIFLGALITKDGLCEKEVRRRIAMGKAAMGGLTSIWKDRGVTMERKWN